MRALQKQDNELVSVKERNDTNLSGNQIYSVFDFLLKGAIEPLTTQTSLVRRGLSEVLFQVHNDKRRRISSLKSQNLVNLLFTSIVTPSPRRHYKTALRCRLDKAIWQQIIEVFIDKTKGYKLIEIDYVSKRIRGKKVQSELMLIHNLEQFFGSSRTTLGQVHNWTVSYYADYMSFKSSVLEKYFRLAFMESKRSAGGTVLLVDSHDLYKNLLLAADKAISKYDPNKGALTSYIQTWFKHSKSNPDFGHLYGMAYSVSDETRRTMSRQVNDGKVVANNFANNLDDAEKSGEINPVESTVEDDIMKSNLQGRVLKLLPEIRDCKYSLILLGLPYTLNDEQKKLLEASYVPSEN